VCGDQRPIVVSHPENDMQIAVMYRRPLRRLAQVVDAPIDDVAPMIGRVVSLLV
jgi:hypothetical protein